eukprot:TRINITY_DN20951_c0_g1_i1.p1 TRINITY_DN20951_c0_g1~~TRINITY_DN20951_c0_g1_i1.p1  ORF type:complete len:1886 (+),score=318.00 TRINITY_DN20951_c0_g1_i1:165-5822(+)
MHARSQLRPAAPHAPPPHRPPVGVRPQRRACAAPLAPSGRVVVKTELPPMAPGPGPAGADIGDNVSTQAPLSTGSRTRSRDARHSHAAKPRAADTPRGQGGRSKLGGNDKVVPDKVVPGMGKRASSQTARAPSKSPPAQGTESQQQPRRSVSAGTTPRARPHPAVQVMFAREDALAAAKAARPAAVPVAEGGTLLLLGVSGILPQEAVATYRLQVQEVRSPGIAWAPEAATCAPSSTGSKSKRDNAPKAKSAAGASQALKRGSLPDLRRRASAAEADNAHVCGWQDVPFWYLPHGGGSSSSTSHCSSASSGCLAAELPRELLPGSSSSDADSDLQQAPGFSAITCRLMHKHLTDWNKWSQVVRKDTGAWLGQASMPAVLGLAPPQVQCRVEAAGLDGLCQKVVLHWSVEAESNDVLRHAGRPLWQYRWRWHGAVRSKGDSGWTAGPMLTTSWEASGSYRSPPLQGPWTPRASGLLELAVRYTGSPDSADVSIGIPGHCYWSEWSRGAVPVALGVPQPQQQVPAATRTTSITRAAATSTDSTSTSTNPTATSTSSADTNSACMRTILNDHDPTRAELLWAPFVATGKYQNLEYQVLLRSAEGAPVRKAWSEEPASDWQLVAWLERLGQCEQDAWLSCSLQSLMPGKSYLARVEARCVGSSSWSGGVECNFCMPAAVAEDGTHLPAPELSDVETEEPGTSKDEAFWRHVVIPPLAKGSPACRLEWRPCVPGAAWSTLELHLPAAAGHPRAPQAEEGAEQDQSAVSTRLPAVTECHGHEVSENKHDTNKHDTGRIVRVSLAEVYRCNCDAALLRWACGTEVGSMTYVAPSLQAPTPPRGNLIARDGVFMIALAFHTGRGHEATCRYQIRCEAERDTAFDLPVRSMEAYPQLRKSAEIQVLLGRDHLVAGPAYTFRVRVGDSSGWSPWSGPSRQVIYGVEAPRPRPNGELKIEPCSAALTALEDTFCEDGSRDTLPSDLSLAASSISSARLSWDPFLLHDGLQMVDYHIDVAPILRPEDADEHFVPGQSCMVPTGVGVGRRETILRHLTPNTEYLFVLSACSSSVEPGLSADAGGTLTSKFRMPALDKQLLDPLSPPLPQPADDGDETKRSFQILVDARAAIGWRRASNSDPALPEEPLARPLYSLQWQECFANESSTGGQWRQASSVEVRKLPGKGQLDLPFGLVPACWHVDESEASQLPERIRLRLVLEDPIAKLLLPQHLWFSSSSAPIATAFETPSTQAASLVWESGSLSLSVPLLPGAPSWQTAAAFCPQHATRCQARFSGSCVGDRAEQHIFQSEPHSIGDLKELQSKTPAAKALTLSLKSLPFRTSLEYRTSIRIGDAQRWSAWSDFGPAIDLTPPKIWCEGEVLSASQPLNRRVHLEWSPVRCCLGAIPVECMVCMVLVDEISASAASEQVLALCTCIAKVPELACHEEVFADSSQPKPDWVDRDKLDVIIQGFEPGATYQYVLYARPKLPLPSCDANSSKFSALARSAVVQWPACLDEEWSSLVDWSLPQPLQMTVDSELEETSRRWQGNSVLLAWPLPDWNVSMPLPLHLEAREESSEVHTVFSWKVVPWVRVRLSGCDYVAACDLASPCLRFRWCRASTDADAPDGDGSSAPGPCSDVCVAHLPTPGAVTAESFCSLSGLRVRLKATCSAPLATSFRVRYRMLGSRDSAAWRTLAPQPLRCGTAPAGAQALESCVGEEHGIEPGQSYSFGLQLLASGRRSRWSQDSAPLACQVPLTFSDGMKGELILQARSASSITCSWPELMPPAVLTPDGASAAGRCAQLEYRLDVRRRLSALESSESGWEHQTSVLLEGDEAGATPTEASVFNLTPATEYAAELFVRFARLGSRSWQSTGLHASFVTPAEEEVKRTHFRSRQGRG